MTKKEFAEVFALLAESYGGRGVGANTGQTYLAVLGHHDIADVRVAAMQLILTEQDFLPTPAKIEAAIQERKLGLPDVEATVSEIFDAMPRIGGDRLPNEHDGLSQLALAAIRLAGHEWRAWCSAQTSDHMTTRSAVRQYVKDARARSIQAASLKAIGIAPPVPVKALVDPVHPLDVVETLARGIEAKMGTKGEPTRYESAANAASTAIARLRGSE